MRQGAIDAFPRITGSQQYRTRVSEIKFVSTLNVAQLQRERDALAKEYRELDTLIQAANWTVELAE
jgi:hypothetical protein